MTKSIRRTIGPAAVVATAAIITGGAVALQPATAQGLRTLAATITCATSTPCAAYQNNSTGAGVQGSAVNNDGVIGNASGATKSGVLGQATAYAGGYGVHGSATSAKGVGVYGTGAGIGVEAVSSGPESLLATTYGGTAGLFKAGPNGFAGIFNASNGTAGLFTATNGFATNMTATTGYGILAGSQSGIAIDAQSDTGYSIIASSTSGTAINGYTGSNYDAALYASNDGTAAGQYDADGAHILSDTGNGAILSNGAYYDNSIDAFTADGGKFGAIVGGLNQGLIALSGGGTSGVPLQAGSANSAGTGTGFFWVDGSGNIHYTGSLISYARTRGGSNVTAYETKSTQPRVEDSGTAQLVAGTAVVQLDPAFAQSIDMSSPYRVFLTPNGDTRGLYVAQKTASGFVVRETQGGRESLSFDYRILASAAGQSGSRMTMVTPAVQAKFFPMLGAHRSRSFSGIPAPLAVPKPRVSVQ